MYARVISVKTEGGTEVRERFAAATEKVFPALTAQTGCLGGFVLNDPMAGSLDVVVLWRKAEDIVNVQGALKLMRDEMSWLLGVDVTGIEVRTVDVLALDVERAIDAADRTGVEFPMLRPNSDTTLSL